MILATYSQASLITQAALQSRGPAKWEATAALEHGSRSSNRVG
jgi:hypothetical protein